MDCPICGFKTPVELYALHDDRYGYPQEVRLSVCTDCGHRFADPPLRADVLQTIYTKYYQRDAIDPAQFKPYHAAGKVRSWLSGDLSSAARWVPAGVRILDIGCGFGGNVAFHANRGCEAHGIDADANVRLVAERFGLSVRVGLFDPGNYQPAYFDYVTMDQVIEHVSDPVATLSDVRKVLKPGGHLVVSTPNANGWGTRFFGRRWLNWHVPYHQQFISAKSLDLLANKTGFVVERVSTISRSAWLIYQVAHLLTCPQPGVASVFWAPKKQKPGPFQFVMLKVVMATRLTLIPQLATRLFDSLGIGDNYLVILRKAGPDAQPGSAPT